MSGFEVRLVVEQFYDVQKLRVQAGNRLVGWAKENADRLKAALSQVKIETQEDNASHTHDETQYTSASQQKFETPTKDASQRNLETHEQNASQGHGETHNTTASQCYNEAHNKVASHGTIETQDADASQQKFETQNEHALFLLEDKKYAEFVKLYLIRPLGTESSRRGKRASASHINAETQHASASHLFVETQKVDASQYKNETPEKHASHTSNEIHKSIASRYQLEPQLDDALRPLASEVENLVWLYVRLKDTEAELKKRLDLWSQDHPLRVGWLDSVKGIGPIFASGLIAWLDEPIKNANHVSSLWSYCGYTPQSIRKAGVKMTYNPRLKTFIYKIGQSFIKYKCFGRTLYDKFKPIVQEKHPDWSKGHVHNYTRRKVVKLFLAALWESWRKMNNLPTAEHYALAELKHVDKITPGEWVDAKTAGSGEKLPVELVEE